MSEKAHALALAYLRAEAQHRHAGAPHTHRHLKLCEAVLCAHLEKVGGHAHHAGLDIHLETVLIGDKKSAYFTMTGKIPGNLEVHAQADVKWIRGGNFVSMAATIGDDTTRIANKIARKLRSE